MKILNIEVIRPTADGLTRCVWNFSFIQSKDALCMTEFYFQSRPSKRHGWKNIEIFSHYDRRNNTMDIADVTLPDDVKVEVYEKFMDEMNKVKIVKEW